ncbi:unnamed protein product [Heterobilharzia americana]|nr:unnamed protein product [Heterobilharzia americana]
MAFSFTSGTHITHLKVNSLVNIRYKYAFLFYLFIYFFKPSSDCLYECSQENSLFNGKKITSV